MSPALAAPGAPRWYVARTHPNQEKLASWCLEQRGYQTYLPLYLKLDPKNPRRAAFPAPLIPGYLFARFAIGAPGWTRIFTTRGVRQVLGNGPQPVAVPDAWVAYFHDKETDGLVRLGLPGEASPTGGHAFKAGQPVQVRKGLTLLDGVFVAGLPDGRRARIFIQAFGALRETDVDIGQLQPKED